MALKNTNISDLVALQNNNTNEPKKIDDNTKNTSQEYKMKIVWRNVFALTILHCLAFYGVSFLAVVKLQTFVFAILLFSFSSLGVTAGAHRLWTHRSYQANVGARIFLAFFFVMDLQNDIYEWVRDHR